MLHSKKNFLFGIIFAVLFTGSGLAAGSNNTSVKGGWNSGNANGNAVSQDTFLLAGCFGANEKQAKCHGTWDDEGAIVINMARKFNDNGGYFCPTQIQFGNSNVRNKVWVNFYKPGDNSVGCKWICKQGFKGENCAEVDTSTECDGGSFLRLKRGALRISGKSKEQITETIDIFEKQEERVNKGSAYVSVLGILAYYQHGVLVGRIKIFGTRSTGADWGKDSWPTGTETSNERYLLCDSGYKPNAARTDCEPIDQTACETPHSMCSGWTTEEFDANAGELEYKKVGNCYQYRCSDTQKGFIDANTRQCVECGTGIRGGPSPDTGVCKECSTGQYFNKDTNRCETAKQYSKQLMQYGSSGSTQSFEKQCWTKEDPAEYKECMGFVDKDQNNTSGGNRDGVIKTLNGYVTPVGGKMNKNTNKLETTMGNTANAQVQPVGSTLGGTVVRRAN